jgi:predicted ribosomally synthesized peptide with SipW-like signal peptide
MHVFFVRILRRQPHSCFGVRGIGRCIYKINKKKERKKPNMKKILALVACLSLVASLAIGGSIAYLTDRDSKANVFTIGNVEITLEEDFGDGSTLIPGQEINKEPYIVNTGKNDAWVWATYAIPEALNKYIKIVPERSPWVGMPFRLIIHIIMGKLNQQQVPWPDFLLNSLQPPLRQKGFCAAAVAGVVFDMHLRRADEPVEHLPDAGLGIGEQAVVLHSGIADPENDGHAKSLLCVLADTGYENLCLLW